MLTLVPPHPPVPSDPVLQATCDPEAQWILNSSGPGEVLGPGGGPVLLQFPWLALAVSALPGRLQSAAREACSSLLPQALRSEPRVLTPGLSSFLPQPQLRVCWQQPG